ncbi:MAG: NUDIX domain-containing protein [Balneolaceae bacterium]|jgi:dATP pyrophosphohydrolase
MHLVDVYPYRKEQNKVKHLIFKRTTDVIYSHQWRMIGGKVKNKEKAYEAALRELAEETGIQPSLFWTIPSLNSFYEHQTDTIHQIPAFAAEIEPGKIPELNHEHSRYRWISEDEIDQFIMWPEQRRLMHLLTLIKKNNQILEEWIIKVNQ